MCGYEWTERKYDNILFNVYFFIAVFNFLFPVKAALHYGGFYKEYISEFQQCRQAGKDLYGGNLEHHTNISSETKCVEICLGIDECMAITQVGPKPSSYDNGVIGCHTKNWGYTESISERSSNMVSFDIGCVKDKYSK